MKQHKVVRVLLGGYWVKKSGKWRSVSRGAYKQAVKQPELHFLEDYEDWTGEESERIRLSALVLAFCTVLVSGLWYAAGFPL